MRPSCKTRAAAFTLVEMLAVIAMTGVLAAVVAVFIRAPIQAYQDSQRRASLSDAADTAFSIFKRDLQTALPNSVRVTTAGSVFYLEFLQVRTGGRYRADDTLPSTPSGANTCADTDGDALANENVLQFGVADTCFTTIGAVSNFSAVQSGNDFVAVYNLGPGYSGGDAYASGNATGGNKSLITAKNAGAGGENVLTFQSNTFTLESPARRFHIVSGPVSYVCDPTAGTLQRVAGYAIAAAQPTPPAGTTSLLARNINGCTITYDQNAVNQRTGVVAMWLRLADPSGGANVNLFEQVQVANEP